MKRRTVILSTAAALVVALIVLGIVVSRQRLRRHRVFRTAPAETPAKAPAATPGPVEQWSEQFRALEAAGQWDDLDELLEQIEKRNPELYAKWSLGYLHARALIEENDHSEAAAKLAPFLAAGHPFRDLALFHQAELAEGAEASRARQTLITEYPQSLYREEAIDDEVDYLTEAGGLAELAAKVMPSANTARRRDITARLIAANPANALARGFALLQGGMTDDAADRVSRVLDRPELIAKMSVEQKALLGETFQSHRHFDRAVALLQAAIAALPPPAPPKAAAAAPTPAKPAAKKTSARPPKKRAPAKKAAPPPPPKPAGPDRNELQFALGRSDFGNEKYAEAQQTYLRGAAATTDMRWKATFFFHASRAAQLQGDDATAEKLMTSAIAVPGRFPATTAALTQRLRTRLKAKRVAEAAGDLAQIRKLAPNDRAVVEASLAYAIGLLALGNHGGAHAALDAIPRNLLNEYDRPELAYWRARALEASDPRGAFAAYLSVLRADAPSHFAYFARERLDSPAMAQKLAQELTTREAQVTNLVNAKQFDLARRVQTDRILLSSKDRPRELEKLAAIYRQIPAYREVLELTPATLPKFPLENPDRATLLMAMGLFDEATDSIEKRYALRPMRAGLTRSRALNLGNASRESIYAIEVMMKSVPEDFVPDLLPRVVRELLYPRYFYDFIAADAEKYKADPTLVLSIMREESRFNPRAKSQAAARGLLQFIITTARDIGRDVGLVDVAPEDLYDPRVIIRLGAKYVSELSQTFGGNRYRAAAAYNAGPKQVALWSRIAPAPGDDFFLSSVNFDETKHYVRKVMNSYRRYAEIYGGGAPAGGLRVEP